MGWWKKTLLASLVAVSGLACAEELPENIEAAQGAAEVTQGCGLLAFSKGARIPLIGAAGDSITTYIALHQPNVVESNGLINTTPIGLLGLFVIKAGIVRYADGEPNEVRAPLLKMAAGAWAGISISNLIIATGASTPVGLAIGFVAGTFAYMHEAKVLQAEAAVVAGAPRCS